MGFSRVGPLFANYVTFPHRRAKVTVGTAKNYKSISGGLLGSGEYFNGMYQSTGADGDTTLNEFEIGVTGIYDIEAIVITDSSSGKMDIYIDDVYAGTFDFYTIGAGGNRIYILSVPITPGPHVFKTVINGKNASSAGYFATVAEFNIYPH